MTNRFVAIVVAVWMTSAAIVALLASAAPPHVVAGGLFGPGVSSSSSNPANAAGFAFYSPSQPTYPVLVGADSFTPADDTLPALWAKDIGAAWNWIDGDEVLVVAETRRGVGGWTGTNRTSSIDGQLQLGASVQDLGNGTLEALPTLIPTSGGDYVHLAWSSLTDTNLNLVSFEVFHATSAAGPWTTAVARVPQGPAPQTNQTGLSPGLHCYAVGANYRSGAPSGVYTTLGLSEPVCATIVDVPPRIIQISPPDGQVGVAVAADIVVTFSEAMNTGSVVANIAPSLALTYTWSSGDTVLTLSHGTAFTACTQYTVTITGDDLTGNALVGGPVPNPFDFTALCPSPFIASTTPAHNALQVRTDSTITIVFSEAMNRASFASTLVPARPLNPPAWSAGDTTVTLTPTSGLAEGTVYTVTVTAAEDLSGNSFVLGPVANPWSFTTNNKPEVTLDPGLSGVCVTGGFDLLISWTMSDTETATSSLRVWLNATGAITGPIAGPLVGLLSYSWPTPFANGTVDILIEVADGKSEQAQDTGAVEIDSAAPTVVSISPADGAANVPTDATVTITFSEAMDETATERASAIAFSPALTGTVSYVLSPGGTVLNVTATFAQSTTYTITLSTGAGGARDACDPGHGLAAVRTSQFTTGAGPKTPNAPSGLRRTSVSATAVALAWDRPTLYSDNSSLAASNIGYYRVYRSASATGPWTELTGNGTVTSAGGTYVDSTVQGGVQYYYRVKVWDNQGRESPFSGSIEVRTQSPTGGEFPVLLLLIPLIVLLLIVGIWLMRRKKPEGGGAPPAKAPPGKGPSGGTAAQEGEGEVMPEEPPPEPAEETSGQFLACPNCGTMVKPTDAECFVCGAKL